MPRKKKRKVDPNAPKRPSSAYMLYMAKVRNKIIRENGFEPSDIANIGKELGRTWKRMGPKQRAPYEKRASIEYDRYCKAKRKYDAIKAAENGDEIDDFNTTAKRYNKKSRKSPYMDSDSPKRVKKKIGRPRKNGVTLAKKKKKNKSKKRKRDSSEVRKPLTSYLCFCKVARPYLMVHYKNDSFANMGKKLGVAWKSLNFEDKYPFYAAAEADRLRYLRECREINQEPMYAPSLAGLSVERWQNYIQGKDIQFKMSLNEETLDEEVNLPQEESNNLL
jgi:hypothetical protein